jgi:predicted TIM-barrel fold metal-dependent hydrolase
VPPLQPEAAMHIVDAQVHIWAGDWVSPSSGAPLSTGAHRSTPLLPDELLAQMDEAGVDRAVLVPPTWDGNRNGLSLQAAQTNPARLAVMGRLPLAAPASRAALPGWRQTPQMLGLRYNFTQAADRAALTDGTADWLWPAAERHQVPLMLLVPHDLAAIGAIAGRHPGLPIVIDHVAIPGLAKGDAAFAHLPELLALARHANIGVKLSGLPSAATDAYPYRSIHEPLRRVFDAFGPQRVFWATDLTRLPCTYGEAVTMFTDEIPWLSHDDKEWVMGRAILAWLRWSPPEA